MRFPYSHLLIALLIPAMLTACLPQTYEIHPDEISRLIKTDPVKRGESIAVAQETSDSIKSHHGPRSSVVVVHQGHGHHHAPPRRAPAGSSSTSREKAEIEDSKEGAVVLVVLAIALTIMAVNIEGSRFQGLIAVDSEHPIHMLGRDGSYAWNYLSALSKEDVRPGDRFIIAEDDGEGFTFLERFPLDREGLLWRLELGGAQNNFSPGKEVMGMAARMFLGGYISQTFGLGFMMNFSGGNETDTDFYNFQYGLEFQAMPYNLGALHFGGYGWAGFAYNHAAGGNINNLESHGLASGAGLLLEWDVNTNLGITMRAGGSWEKHGPNSSIGYRGMNGMIGVSIY
jgi:hypothetical protein